MKRSIILDAVGLHEFDEPREGALGMHHLKYLILLAVSAIPEQKGGDDV